MLCWLYVLLPQSPLLRRSDRLTFLDQEETARVYNWLISERSHLKDNCTREPPYDWNDFKEQWKDDAANRIARGGDQFTSWYWGLASQQDSCPNWIARWFLYHKFRHNDGRSGTPRKSHGKHTSQRKQKSRGQEELVPFSDNAEETKNAGEYSTATNIRFVPGVHNHRVRIGLISSRA